MYKIILVVVLVVIGGVVVGSVGVVDLVQYLCWEIFIDIKILLGGEYVVVMVLKEDSIVIVILWLKDKQLVGSFWLFSCNYVQEFDWVSNECLLIGLVQKWGLFD